MKVTVNALLAAVPLVAPLGLVSMLFFMVFAILGVQLFAGRYSGMIEELAQTPLLMHYPYLAKSS